MKIVTCSPVVAVHVPPQKLFGEICRRRAESWIAELVAPMSIIVGRSSVRAPAVVVAAVGAAFVSWVAEGTLTGPGAGGFMLVHRARDRSTRVYDFFVAVPGLGLDSDVLEMDRVDVDFSGGSTQMFRIGAPSCAVPG